ncbi:MAG: tRNA (adenosine(37)-N6)-threonylcarbamoyltransferase complex ATPase subunit type 1 TsaE [Bacteroidetes bacterium]|nr:tRNA (adenosine(37)-N6)-threonylcarbamoyltransferase complex ATPase subunit type 1 TsaE [Bacteroidota bacterium]
MKIDWKVNSIDELPAFANEFLKFVNYPKCIAFRGEMGAGKTTFTRALIEALGVQEFEGSPTFAIIQEYPVSAKGKIYHMDCYRIKSIAEAINIGLEEILDEKSYIFIEWAEKIEALLPNDIIWVYIRNNDDLTRQISFEL